jgi:hypothetical protein
MFRDDLSSIDGPERVGAWRPLTARSDGQMFIRLAVSQIGIRIFIFPG